MGAVGTYCCRLCLPNGLKFGPPPIGSLECSKRGHRQWTHPSGNPFGFVVASRLSTVRAGVQAPHAVSGTSDSSTA
jgi:hypothetical protein